MRTLGNIIWHIPFLGFISAILVWLLGLLLTVTVIASPIGLGLMEFGRFLFWPFGNAMVSQADLEIEQHPLWRGYSTLVMIGYLPFGLLLALLAVFQVVALFVSIIGIPPAIVVAKSLGTYLQPVNKKCVNAALVQELELRRARADLES